MRKFVMLKFTSIIFLLKHSISNSLNPHVNGWWGGGGEWGDGGVGVVDEGSGMLFTTAASLKVLLTNRYIHQNN